MRPYFFAIIGIFWVTTVHANDGYFPKEITVINTNKPFSEYIKNLKTAIGENKMGVVGEACATCGAKAIGIEIPENRVVMIFNPYFAVRMLKASIPAGVEAPLRLYVIETKSGTAQLSYKKPSLVFAPYENKDLNAMAMELDVIFEQIISSAGSK